MLGDKIKNIRVARGLTTIQLGEMTGLSSAYISMIENNKRNNPRVDSLQKIADALGIPLSELCGDVTKTEGETFIAPEKFTDPISARTYAKSILGYGSEGRTVDNLTDKEVIEYANDVLEYARYKRLKIKK